MAEDILSPAKNRQDVWAELGAQQYNAPEDLYQPDKPVAYDTVPKVGILSAFVKGVPSNKDSSQPYNPSYQPTFGETIASTLTDFVRSGVAVGAEWTPEMKAARTSLDELRNVNPEAADQLEAATIGKKLSNTKLAEKGAAALGEAALTIAPWFKFGRAGLAAGEIALLGKTGKALKLAEESAQITKNVAKVGLAEADAAALKAKDALSGLGKVGKAFVQSPTLQKLYSGGLNGFLYGGLYGLHTQDADWKEGAKNAVLGGVFGTAFMGATSGLAFLGKYGGNKALQGFKFGGEVLGNVREKLHIPTLSEALPKKWYANIFGVGSAMKKYYGDIGTNFLNMYRKASRLATADLGKIQLAFIDNGLMKAPAGFGKAFKGVEFVGDDAERMLYYNQVLRGQGAYADKAAQRAAIAADPKLQFLDGIRKDYGNKAAEVGVTQKLLDTNTYLPKHTPVIELGADARSKLAKATTQAEREAIYAANDPMVKEMVDNAFKYEKAFTTLDEAYGTYYDYADAVTGGSHTPMGDNKMLQRMVANGEAKTIEEARGKIISDLKLLKRSLTPDAASLDFERQVNLPWYDPNPSRVMQTYTMDASMRIEMAKMFGVNDEVINKMIGSIKSNLTGEVSADAAARSFEDFVRVVTGQVFHSQKEQKVSAFLRALQIPKLAFAQIMNLGQSLNTLLASDIGSVAHGITTAFTVPEIRKAIERGVLMNQFIRQIFENTAAGGGSKFTDKLLKYNGFTFTEMFNRVIGSSASDVWGEKNLAKLLTDYGIKPGESGVAKSADRQAIIDEIKIDQPREYWALKELGINPDEVIARGSFTPEEKALAAQTFVERTQFLANPSDLPYFASSPWGKILFQFRTFTYQQARFVTDELKNAFARKDYTRGFRNLLILSTVFPMTGEVLSDVRSLITQEKRPTKFLDRYLADIFSAGTYGLFYDFATAAERGKVSDFFLGTTLSDAIKYLEIGAASVKQIPAGHGGTALNNFTKQLLRQTGVGRVIVNTFYKNSKQGKSTLKSLIDWSAD